jgi:DNA-binding response OmpR family regulator
MHVAKLRKKLEGRASHPEFLVTVHGMGYKFTG